MEKKFGYMNPNISRSSPNLVCTPGSAKITRGMSGTGNLSLKETRENAQVPKSHEKVLQKVKEVSVYIFKLKNCVFY